MRCRPARLYARMHAAMSVFPVSCHVSTKCGTVPFTSRKWLLSRAKDESKTKSQQPAQRTPSKRINIYKYLHKCNFRAERVDSLRYRNPRRCICPLAKAAAVAGTIQQCQRPFHAINIIHNLWLFSEHAHRRVIGVHCKFHAVRFCDGDHLF